MTQSKIVVTGGSGLVGKALKKYLPNAVYLSSKDFDLTNENQVKAMYGWYKPEVVIHLAAKVGGILDNISNNFSNQAIAIREISQKINSVLMKTNDMEIKSNISDNSLQDINQSIESLKMLVNDSIQSINNIKIYKMVDNNNY